MVFSSSSKEEPSLNSHDHHQQNSPNGGGFKFSLSSLIGAKSKQNNSSASTTISSSPYAAFGSSAASSSLDSNTFSHQQNINNNNNGSGSTSGANTPRRKISNPKAIPMLNTAALNLSNQFSEGLDCTGSNSARVVNDQPQTKLYSIIHELQLNVNFNQGMNSSTWNGYFDGLYEHNNGTGSPGIVSITPRGSHHLISQSMPHFVNPNSPSSSTSAISVIERKKGLRNLVMGKSMNNLDFSPSSTMSQFDVYLMKKERKLLQKFGRFLYVKSGVSPVKSGNTTPRTPRTPRASPLVIMRPKENSNNFEEMVLDGFNLIPSPRPSLPVTGALTPRTSSEKPLDDSPISEYAMDDATFLDRPTTDNITNLLESRYTRKDQTQKKSPLVYTYLGDALIFVNPNDIKETEGLYKHSVMHFYHKKLPFARAPHIFSIAENSFRTMKETRQPQTIIVNGESGSGKTETSKLILKYLTVVSQNGPSSYFVKHVLTESNQLLEAFGNAKTLHCDNSSRFGKYTTVYFGFGDRIEGGKISTILLEKSHITNQRKKERNFHIFYQLCRGADKSMKEEFHLHDPSDFLYLNSTETVIDGVDDMREFKKTIKSMDSVGFTYSERMEVLRIVAGILHLGNIQFVEGNVKDRAEIVESDALKWASLCFGVQPNQLKHALLIRTLHTEERVFTYQNAVQARFNRDALAKGMYERLFLWIVQKINSVIKPKSKNMVTKIGILDLYGFEIYPSDNSLEQLNINFVNEKLQQHTLKLLQQEKDEYVKEGIFNMDLFTILSKELKKDFLSDFDTINDCISCIEDQPLGIYSLLDEEDYLNGSGGDERYLAKLKENLKKSNSFEPARFKSTTFSLKHFAAKVDYNVTGWVKKNKDTLFKDLIDTMCKSSSHLVQELFKPLDDFYSGRESKQRRLQETIVKQFKRDVNKLMNKKLKGKIHFIYCIKPNYDKKALKFDKKTISNQVKCLGLSSISIFKQHGFFFKMHYPKFFAKYKSLSPSTWPSASPDFDIEELKSKIKCILAESKIDGNNHAFGKTEIFLKTPLDVAILIDRFEQIQEAVAVLIQRKYREVVHKRSRRKSEKIKVQLNNVHERMYSEYGEHNVVQITNGKSISRLLVISKTNICFLDPDTYEMVFNFPLSIIHRLCMSRFSDGIVIICMRNFGDIVLDVENKQHLYQDIESSFHKLMSSLLDSYKPISIEFHSVFYVHPSVLVLEDNEMKQKAEYEIFLNSLPRNSNGDYQHQINVDSDDNSTESNYSVQFLKDYTIAAMKIERRPNNGGLIIYVKPNEDIYTGKKKRRQGSFDRYFVGDSLRWKEKLGEDRDILFSDLVDKYHKSFKKSERYIIITERSLYIEHKFLKKRRRIPLRKIYKLSVSPFTDHYFFIHVRGESDILLESIKKTEIISILSNTVKATLPRVFEIDITTTVTQVTKNPTLVRQVIFEEVSSPQSCRIEYTKASEPIRLYIHNEDVVDEFAKTILDVYGGKKSRRICSLKSADDIEDAIFMREVLFSDNTTPMFVAEVEFVNPYTLSSVRKNMSISNSTVFLLGKKESDGLKIEIEEITSIICSSQCDDLFVLFCGESAYLFNSDLKTKIIETLKVANSKIQIIVESKLIIPFKDLFVWDGESNGSYPSDMESLSSLADKPREVEEPTTPPSTPQPQTHFLESPLTKKKGTNGNLIITVLVDRNISEPKIMCNNEQANAKLTIRINDQDPAFPFYPLFSKSKKG